MSAPVFRFAPSPNGYMHVGHALSALMNFELAQSKRGRFLLRIDDIDRTRCRADYETAIYEDLAWLGLSWEQPVRRQSDHLDDYRAALARLADMGLVYPGFESRNEIAGLVAEREANGPWPRDPDGVPLYPGSGRALANEERKRRIAAGEPYALRLDMMAAIERAGSLFFTEHDFEPGADEAIEAQPQAWGDVVLARKETPSSYHLSVVVDDAVQGVTHVVRGEDLFAATSVHCLLQHLLGLPTPVYHHHRLILDAEGRKLAKSTGSTALRELRGRGMTPRAIRRTVGLSG
jgi:glutamyl-Q tRNA(Asp) synthetase